MKHKCLIICGAAVIMLPGIFPFSPIKTALAEEKRITMYFEKIVSLMNRNEDTYSIMKLYQYIATDPKDNSISKAASGDYSFNVPGFSKEDYGALQRVMKARSAVKIKSEWESYKNKFFSIVSQKTYDNYFHEVDCWVSVLAHTWYDIDVLISIKDQQNYNDLISAAVSKNMERPLTGMDYSVFFKGTSHSLDKGFALSFWYRRSLEKNDDAVYAILKEIQKHYSRKEQNRTPN
ncbi:MAG: hypothetical protein ACRCUT_07100 [Spirochaetota bacterium]